MVSFNTKDISTLYSDKILFKIARSKDANEIKYALNLEDKGFLDIDNPLSIYWVKVENHNKQEPLTWIQNHYAYGLKYLSKNKNEASFQFVSYSKREFTVKRNKQSEYAVYTISNGKEVEVKEIFIQIDGGSFWVPKISKVELKGIDLKTKLKYLEVIKP